MDHTASPCSSPPIHEARYSSAAVVYGVTGLIPGEVPTPPPEFEATAFYEAVHHACGGDVVCVRGIRAACLRAT